VLRSLIASGPGRPSLADGLRVGAATFVPIAVGELVGDLTTGLLVGVGGFMVAQCDGGEPYPARVVRLTAATLGVGAALAAGALVGATTWLTILLVFVVTGAGGLAWALGPGVAIPSFVVAIAFLVGAALGDQGADPGRLFWETVAGGAWAMVLSLAPALLDVQRPLREAVARAYRALGVLVGTVGPARRRVDSAAARANAIEAIGEGRAAVASMRPGELQERLSASLLGAGQVLDATVALAEAQRDAGDALDAVRAEGRAVATAAARDLTRLADALVRDGTVPERGSLDQAVTAFDRARGPAGALARLATVRDRVHALADAVGAAAASVAGERRLDSRPQPPPRPGLAALRAQLTLGSTVLRHALRLGAAAATGLLVAQALHPDHGVWAATAAVIVLKPDVGGTLRHGILRAAGTLLGAVVAGLIAAATDDRLVLTLVAFAVTVATVSVLRVDYGLFMIFITPLAILLVNVATPGHWDVADARLADTLLGCAIALVVGHLLWPTWERPRVPRQLAATLAADRDLVAEAVRERPDPTGLRTARGRAELENANAAAALQRLRTDPPQRRGDVEPLVAFVDASRDVVDRGVAVAEAGEGSDAVVVRDLHARLEELAPLADEARRRAR
jgi:uncharacterized membrane protein YccC